MALNKLKFNSLNVTPAASKAIRFNSSANGLETADAGGSLVFISRSTASSSSSVDITSGISSTYKEYIFILNNMHPETNDKHFTFQVNANGESGFNETITSSLYRAYHLENGSNQGLDYRAANDQAQGTAYQRISEEVGNDADEAVSGILHLFDPSNTTFVKHFIARTSLNYGSPRDTFTSGYVNTTTAIDEISFAFTSGNVDSGTVDMYGVT
tara:strand:+ start:481 stop:1119 length:639 start_codon:yes stop_codon:yes gene_type:complete